MVKGRSVAMNLNLPVSHNHMRSHQVRYGNERGDESYRLLPKFGIQTIDLSGDGQFISLP